MTAEHAPEAFTVVIPTVGRSSLALTLHSLADQRSRSGPEAVPSAVVVVDDRPLSEESPLHVHAIVPEAPWPVEVVRTGGRGPAAARNAGWRSATTPWIAFVDDDVVLPPDWADGLLADLRGAEARTAGVQGRLEVPLPVHRHPTDWERNTAALEDARWVTADMAYRRVALEAVSGFDERFPRAYREDADLALRVREAGWLLARGSRTATHPVRPAGRGVSVRVQAGAADDALMRALHGPEWRETAEVGRGRFRWHVATVVAGAAALTGALARRPRVAGLGLAAWVGLTADFARVRIAPGPRPGEDGWAEEWGRMALTSLVIPAAAVWHRLRGVVVHRGAQPWPVPVRGVLFDRDGTIVHDVPYNGDPEAVRTVDGAHEALDALRAHGIKVGVITNQSGVARGLVTEQQVQAVNARIEAELGPFDAWLHCPHAADDGCTCRKPAPGMVLDAAERLGVQPHECAVIGDIGSDVRAAIAAGARAVIVPTDATRPEEVAMARLTAPDLRAATGLLLGGVGASRTSRASS